MAINRVSGRPYHKLVGPHLPDGAFTVYSDGDGHYAVIGPDGIVCESIACDYCCMKAIELNKADDIDTSGRHRDRYGSLD